MVSSGYSIVGSGAMLESCFTFTSLRGIALLYAEVTSDNELLYSYHRSWISLQL